MTLNHNYDYSNEAVTGIAGNVLVLQAVADKNAPFFGKSQIIQIQNY